MSKTFPIVALLALLALLLPTLAWANTVTFDPLAAGTTYAAGPYAPGDYLFTEDLANVYIEEFFSAGTPYFDFARVENATAVFGSVRIMNTNNVDLLIDFTAPGDVTFEYLDMGGSINLQVNGFGAVLEAGDLAALIGVVAPGVTMNCTVVPVAGGHKGLVTLTGPVQKLRVGGQEFWVENLRCNNGLIPDPGDCDWLVDHESLSFGDAWGTPFGHAPGDLAFVEDGIPVHLDRFVTGGTGYFNYCEVVPTLDGMGDSRVMNLNNISNVYGISAVGAWVAEVTFEFLSYGGDENIEVNGAGLYVGDIESAPAAIAPGVNYSVTTTPVGGGVRGVGRLVGRVDRLLLGGQEFYVDNICVRKHAASGVGDRTPGLQGRRVELQPNFPNPFNPRTTLSFRLEQGADVRLTIHDMAGRLVKTLLAEHRDAGSHQVVWNGTDERGGAAPAGVYLVRVATGDGEVETQKIGLIK